jgi:hypothetical protein
MGRSSSSCASTSAKRFIQQSVFTQKDTLYSERHFYSEGHFSNNQAKGGKVVTRRILSSGIVCGSTKKCAMPKLVHGADE